MRRGNTCRIYSEIVDFEKIVNKAHLKDWVAEIKKYPQKYCGYNNEDTLEQFLDSLWIQMPYQEREIRLTDYGQFIRHDLDTQPTPVA
jgi:hypothetical protein